MGLKEFGENTESGIDGPTELFLLTLDDSGDITLLLLQFGILAAADLNNGGDDLVEEWIIDPKKLSMP